MLKVFEIVLEKDRAPADLWVQTGNRFEEFSAASMRTTPDAFTVESVERQNANMNTKLDEHMECSFRGLMDRTMCTECMTCHDHK